MQLSTLSLPPNFKPQPMFKSLQDPIKQSSFVANNPDSFLKSPLTTPVQERTGMEITIKPGLGKPLLAEFYSFQQLGEYLLGRKNKQSDSSSSTGIVQHSIAGCSSLMKEAYGRKLTIKVDLKEEAEATEGHFQLLETPIIALQKLLQRIRFAQEPENFIRVSLTAEEAEILDPNHPIFKPSEAVRILMDTWKLSEENGGIEVTQ